MSTFVCPGCVCPSRLPDACDNPGCPANPRVTDEQRAHWRAEAEFRAKGEAERDWLRRTRQRMVDHG